MTEGGRVWRFGDAVSIEDISPLHYMLDPADRARMCLARLDPRFGVEVRPGDVIVAGRLFGFGPGHDHGVLALREAGVAAVIAVSFGFQFYRHAVSHGLPVVECAEAAAALETESRVTIDRNGNILDIALQQTYRGVVPTGPAADILKAGGLMPFLRGQIST